MEAVSIFLLVLKVLLWLIALILLVPLAAVLFVPVSFRTRAEGALHPDVQEEWDGWARWEADVRWGGFLFRMWLQGTHKGVQEMVMSVCGFRLSGGKRSSGKNASADKPEAAAKKKKKARRRTSVEEIRSFIREGIQLARRLLRALRLRVEGDIRFGFEDPATTGLTLGAVYAVGKPAGLAVTPDWLNPGVDGWVTARGRVYGTEVAIALWRAYWRSPLGRRLRKRFTFRFGKKRMMQEVEYHGRAG